MIGQGGLERNITSGKERLCDRKGMNGFAAVTFVEHINAALEADQGAVLESPVNEAVATGVATAQHFAELAFVENAVGQPTL